MNYGTNVFYNAALNSAAFGPGNYDLTIEALDWRGQASPAAWAAFEVAGKRPR